MSARTAGPDFEGVLAEHRHQYGPAVGQFCSCKATGKPDPDSLTSMQDFHAAHLASALRTEVLAWVKGHVDDAEYYGATEARAALAALAEQVGQVASVGEGEGS